MWSCSKPWTVVSLYHVMIKSQNLKMSRSWKLIGMRSAVAQVPRAPECNKRYWKCMRERPSLVTWQPLEWQHVCPPKNVSKLTICMPWGLLSKTYSRWPNFSALLTSLSWVSESPGGTHVNLTSYSNTSDNSSFNRWKSNEGQNSA